MWKVLSKYQKIAIIILLPFSLVTIWSLNKVINFENKVLDMVFGLVVYFGVPYVFVRASIPIVAFFETFFKKK